jgi:neutral ceramidase
VDLVSRAEPKASLRARAAKIKITPRLGVSLDGPISKNDPVTSVHDRLHARAIVFDDGLTRLAIVICGPCIIGRDVMNPAIMPGNNIALKVPQNTSGESP